MKIDVNKIKLWQAITVAVVIALAGDILLDMMNASAYLSSLWQLVFMLGVAPILVYIARAQRKLPAWTKKDWLTYYAVIIVGITFWTVIWPLLFK